MVFCNPVVILFSQEYAIDYDQYEEEESKDDNAAKE